MVYLVPSIAERVEQSPTMWVQGSLSEKDKVRGLLVQHRNDVGQGGDVGPCFFSVDGEKREPNGRRGRVWGMVGGCDTLCLGRGR